MKFLIFWKPLVWLGLICYGLFIPAGNLPDKPFINIPHFDKMVHFALFFVFCLLLFKPFKNLKLKHFRLAPATAICFGAVLESTQHIVSQSRSSNLSDFLANVAGIAFSVVFYSFMVTGKKWENLF